MRTISAIFISCLFLGNARADALSDFSRNWRNWPQDEWRFDNYISTDTAYRNSACIRDLMAPEEVPLCVKAYNAVIGLYRIEKKQFADLIADSKKFPSETKWDATMKAKVRQYLADITSTEQLYNAVTARFPPSNKRTSE